MKDIQIDLDIALPESYLNVRMLDYLTVLKMSKVNVTDVTSRPKYD